MTQSQIDQFQNLLDQLNTLEPNSYGKFFRQAHTVKEKYEVMLRAAEAARGKELRDHSIAEAHKLCSQIDALSTEIIQSSFVKITAESKEQYENWKQLLLKKSLQQNEETFQKELSDLDAAELISAQLKTKSTSSTPDLDQLLAEMEKSNPQDASATKKNSESFVMDQELEQLLIELGVDPSADYKPPRIKTDAEWRAEDKAYGEQKRKDTVKHHQERTREIQEAVEDVFQNNGFQFNPFYAEISEGSASEPQLHMLYFTCWNHRVNFFFATPLSFPISRKQAELKSKLFK